MIEHLNSSGITNHERDKENDGGMPKQRQYNEIKKSGIM
jgi:hypothetical protein